MPTFRAVVESNGKTATGVEVPAHIVAELGSNRRPKVKATMRGCTFRSSVASMGGRFLLGINADTREQSGLRAGDAVDVELQLDVELREVEVPADFATALAAEPDARRFFEGLSYSQRRWFVLGIEGAKKPETRARRIDDSMARLRDSRGQR